MFTSTVTVENIVALAPDVLRVLFSHFVCMLLSPTINRRLLSNNRLFFWGRLSLPQCCFYFDRATLSYAVPHRFTPDGAVIPDMPH